MTDEITPEMIEAGADIIALHWDRICCPTREDLFQEVATQMYRAMRDAQKANA